MMTERSFEYDAFGPWIYPIEGKHTLPPLFCGYEESLRDALMCFKIPRKIDRRDANPNMNLYDKVVAIFKEKILLLERDKHEGKTRVIETSLLLSRIGSICKKTCLLNGTLTLFTTDRNVNIPFNSISEEIISAAVTLIRKLIPREEVKRPLSVLSYDQKDMELHFVAVVNFMRQEDNRLNLIAYQPGLKYTVPRQFKCKVLNFLKLREPVISGFVLLCNDSDLVIINRMYYTKRNPSERYAITTHYLPLSSIEKVESVPFDGGYPGLRLPTEQSVPILPFEESNESLKTLLLERSRDNNDR